MSMITIKNNKFTVEINSLGAEIFSVKDINGREYIWEGNPSIWEDRAPVLFPVTGSLKDNSYYFQGKKYEMPEHGFARTSMFEVEEKNDSSVTFFLASNDATRAMYPFDFEFRVRYTLSDNSLSVEFLVDNKSERDMYYSVGGHEGYAINGSIDNYSIVLDETETLERYEVLPSLVIGEKSLPCFESSREFKLRDEYFVVDGLIFFDIKSRGIALRDDRNGEMIHVAFPGFETLLVWKMMGAEYVCIEPWAGAPEIPWHKSDDLSNKFRIHTLKPGKSEKYVHTITFGEKA